MAHQTYTPGKNGTLTYNAIVQNAKTVAYSAEGDTDDTSNLGDGGFASVCVGVVAFKMQWELAVKTTTTEPQIGQEFAASFSTMGGLGHSGTLIVTKYSSKGGAKGAYTISIEGQFQGAVVTIPVALGP